MKPNIVTPQQARQMALDHLHRAEAGREACRAKEAHECTWIICHDATKGIDAYAMECLRCGEKQRVALPIGLQMYAAMAKVFTKRHKKCKEKK